MPLRLLEPGLQQSQGGVQQEVSTSNTVRTSNTVSKSSTQSNLTHENFLLLFGLMVFLSGK